MRVFRSITVPKQQRDIYDYTVCDICKDESNEEWAPGFSAFESTVEISDGESFPEGGSGTSIKYDICPKCFKEKLIPWLESQGAETKVNEWDW
jgi:hypothetical protein